MAQLTLEGGVSSVDMIETLAEKYGRISDIRDFAKYCRRHGAFASFSLDEHLVVADIEFIRTKVFKAKRNGLRRMIHTGDTWVSRRLCTEEEHRAHCQQLRTGIKRDEDSLQLELEYHEDRWHKQLVLLNEGFCDSGSGPD